MGKQDGFENLETKHLHDVGVRVIKNTKFSIHENVTEFEEESPHHVQILHTVDEHISLPIIDPGFQYIFDIRKSSQSLRVCPGFQDDYLEAETGYMIQKSTPPS